MTLRIALGWLIPLIFSIHTLADDIKLRPNHPDQYQVIDGDTLWSIAGEFLEKPTQWPMLWRANPQIRNPNLIYPGDVLGLTLQDGKPQISILNRGEILTRDQKLSPQIREYPIEQAIKLIPSNKIAQFLSSPKVVQAGELQAAPYIIDFAGEHLIVGAGDRIYVRSINDAANTQQYIVYRQGAPYISPETSEILGYEATYVADITLQTPGEIATLIVNKASGEIRIGDRVMPNMASPVVLNYFPRPPKTPVTGNIISVLNGVSQIGQYNIVVIDKGTANGLDVGHVLDIFQRGKVVHDKYSGEVNTSVVLPEESAGSLMVFRVFERVSYALVMQATQAIHVLDKVKTP